MIHLRIMAAESLHYFVLPPKPRRFVRIWRPALCVLGAVACLLAAVTLPVWQTTLRVDAVTGSTSTQFTGPFGIAFAPVVDPSPLELQLRQIPGAQFQPNWCRLSTTDRSLIGMPICRACGSAPPIFRLMSLRAQFVNTRTAAQIHEFVRVMRFGTDAEREMAIDAAGDIACRAQQAGE